MKNLNFYTIDFDYVSYLQKIETNVRGFSRVPNMKYEPVRKQKFLCGIVLRINNMDYYVPVTSYKQQKPDNFLIHASDGRVTSSLRFNYMIPAPAYFLTPKVIDKETNRAYRSLLSQELRFCIDNQERIRGLAERTYKRVLLGKDPGLVKNSCDFKLLETACREYIKVFNSPTIEVSDLTSPFKNDLDVADELFSCMSATNDLYNNQREPDKTIELEEPSRDDEEWGER